jgi:F0F1-type ATP synthase assembly protein I
VVFGPLTGRYYCRFAWASHGLWRAEQIVRETVSDERPSPDPLALAMEWVAKITTVALEMVLPAVGGHYLDGRLGTRYWALVGLVLGMVAGMWHLLQMTRPKSASGGLKRKRGGPSSE